MPIQKLSKILKGESYIYMGAKYINNYTSYGL